MIVVSVYRPEAADGPDGSHLHDENPFDGIEVLGLYDDDKLNLVIAMVHTIKDDHPNWHIHIDSGVGKTSVIKTLEVMYAKVI